MDTEQIKQKADAVTDTLLGKVAASRWSWAIVVAWSLACFLLGAFSIGKAHAHGVEVEVGRHVAKYVVKPVIEPAAKAVTGGGGGVSWVPFVAVAGAIGYAVWKVHECDKKPLTDACHPAAVRAEAYRREAARRRAHRRQRLSRKVRRARERVTAVAVSACLPHKPATAR